jgi:hypothetical protein
VIEIVAVIGRRAKRYRGKVRAKKLAVFLATSPEDYKTVMMTARYGNVARVRSVSVEVSPEVEEEQLAAEVGERAPPATGVNPVERRC